MNKKEQSERVLRIIKDYKSHNNKDLLFVLDFIKDDFDETKNSLMRLTNHLDKLESTYNLTISDITKELKK